MRSRYLNDIADRRQEASSPVTNKTRCTRFSPRPRRMYAAARPPSSTHPCSPGSSGATPNTVIPWTWSARHGDEDLRDVRLARSGVGGDDARLHRPGQPLRLRPPGDDGRLLRPAVPVDGGRPAGSAGRFHRTGPAVGVHRPHGGRRRGLVADRRLRRPVGFREGVHSTRFWSPDRLDDVRRGRSG